MILRGRSGDMGFVPKGFSRGCIVFLSRSDITEIVIHKTDQSDAVVALLDAHGPPGEG